MASDAVRRRLHLSTPLLTGPDVATLQRSMNRRLEARKSPHRITVDEWLTEHIWMLIGMAAACQTLPELRQRMAERFGRHMVQYTLFIAPPGRTTPAQSQSQTVSLRAKKPSKCAGTKRRN